MRKILLLTLIILSLLAITILPSARNICISDEACAGETLIQYLSERTQLFNTIIGFQQFIVAVAVLALFFIIRKYLENEKFILARSYAKQKLLNSSAVKLFNYLIEVFFRGILHPKIY